MGDQEQDSSDLQELANTLRDTIANLDTLIEQRAAEMAAEQLVPINKKLADLNRRATDRQQELAALAYLSRFLPNDLAEIALTHFAAAKEPIELDDQTKRSIDYNGKIAWARVTAVIMQHEQVASPYLGCPICHRPFHPLPTFNDTTPLGAVLAYAKASECGWHHRNEDIVTKTSTET